MTAADAPLTDVYPVSPDQTVAAPDAGEPVYRRTHALLPVTTPQTPPDDQQLLAHAAFGQ